MKAQNMAAYLKGLDVTPLIVQIPVKTFQLIIYLCVVINATSRMLILTASALLVAKGLVKALE